LTVAPSNSESNGEGGAKNRRGGWKSIKKQFNFHILCPCPFYAVSLDWWTRGTIIRNY
jgi:hypothetical protein